MTTKIPAWSYSSLTNFEQCPRQFKLLKIDKVVPFKETEAIRHGNEVHKALELRLKDKTPLPAKYAQYESMVAKLDKPGVFVEAEYALTRNLEPCGWWDKSCWVRGKVDAGVKAKDKVLIVDWKGFPIETPIPTPNGFVKIGDVQVGHQVFSGDGLVCTVVGKSSINTRKCFKIAFDDKTSIVCDDRHLWSLVDGTVVPITELKKGDRIKLTGKVEYPEQKLLVDPYVLGIWLADGKHSSGEISKPDIEIFEEIERRGYSVGSDISSANRTATRTVKGIRGLLTLLGVLKNKHIPEDYMKASVQQRIDLVRGLMDGDGSVNVVRKQAVFTTTDKRISDQVKELLESLGQRVNQASTTQRGFGLVVNAYPLAFRPQDFNPFLLKRKADRIDSAWGRGESWYRRVVSIEDAPETDTVCIAVDSADNTFLIGKNYLRTHNTGKIKPESSQLELFAALVMTKDKTVNEVNSRFAWLQDNKTTGEKYYRDDVPKIWEHFMQRVARLENAYENDKWTPKPSGLCGKWCPVGKKHCDFCGS